MLNNRYITHNSTTFLIIYLTGFCIASAIQHIILLYHKNYKATANTFWAFLQDSSRKWSEIAT